MQHNRNFLSEVSSLKCSLQFLENISNLKSQSSLATYYFLILKIIATVHIL